MSAAMTSQTIWRAARAAATAALIAVSAGPAFAQGADPAPSESLDAAADAPFRERALSYVVVDGVGAPDALTDVAGDPERGRGLFSGVGGCAECHADAPGASSPGGPSLAGVGGRLSESALRLWIVNPRVFVEGSTMPAYYSLWPEGEAWPDRDPPRAQPLLSAQQIEDLVAYLNRLDALVDPTLGD